MSNTNISAYTTSLASGNLAPSNSIYHILSNVKSTDVLFFPYAYVKLGPDANISTTIGFDGYIISSGNGSFDVL